MHDAIVATINIRPRAHYDDDAIRAHWLESYRRSRWVSGIDNRTYYAHHAAICNALLDRSVTLIASYIHDPRLIYGWVCAEDAHSDSVIVHYVYVKSAYRRLGIATLLLNTIGVQRGGDVIATHRTYITERDGFATTKLHIHNNPYLIHAKRVGDND